MGERSRKVLVVVNDLFFEAKIGEVLRALGAPFSVAKSEEALAKRLAEAEARLAFVDMGGRGFDGARAIEAARAAGARVVAFISHVDVEAGKKARALGAEEVLAKSELARRLSDLVRRYAEELIGIETSDRGGPR